MNNKINAITPAYASKLDLKIHCSNVGTQKIDKSSLATFRIVFASFQIKDKLGKTWIFQKTFLLANISVKMMLKMPFLTFSNANLQFAKKKLIWRCYITAKALPNIKQVQFINKREFDKAAIDKNVKAFLVHMIFFSYKKLTIIIDLAIEAQITLLLVKKVKILAKHLDFSSFNIIKNNQSKLTCY